MGFVLANRKKNEIVEKRTARIQRSDATTSSSPGVRIAHSRNNIMIKAVPSGRHVSLLNCSVAFKNLFLFKPKGHTVKRFQLFTLLGFVLLCLTGCVKTEDSGTEFKATYELWVGIVAMLIGVGGTIGGWFYRRKDVRGWVLFVFALLATVLFLPFGFVDHVTVSESEIKTQWGFWVYPTKHEFRFDKVQSVSLEKEISRGRRGRKKTNFYLIFRLENGDKEKLIATNALMEASMEKIADQIKARNIPFIDQT